MKYSEFKRWLIRNGVIINESRGKGSHYVATFQGRSVTVPNHGAREMKEPLRKSIIKQLGL